MKVNSSKKRILFVDDEPNFLSGLRRMLRHQGIVWDMAFVQSVDEAIEETGKHAYDAIICDVRMPERDGFDLLKELAGSERTMGIPVIMLTAGRDDDSKCIALNLGATDLIDKPIQREDLLARIRSVLRLKSSQDDLKELNATLEQKVVMRTEDLKRSHLDIIWRLAQTSEYRDEQTGRHIVRVACYSRIVARQMQLSDDFVETLYMSAPLHDIGKIGTPDRILLKPDKLTPEEHKVMEQHCRIGYEILTKSPEELWGSGNWPGSQPGLSERIGNRFVDMAASIALSHHERWDGQGYPEQLRGEEIPLAARIVALADVYDALASERPYKRAFPEGKTLEIIEGGPESQFDPAVYAAFEELTEQFRAIQTRLADHLCLTV